MADSELSLYSLLQTAYPKLSIKSILSVVKKHGNDEEKCRQVLDSEMERGSSDNESSPTASASRNTNGNNNLESPGEGKSIISRIKEFQKSHESGPQPKSANPERHVTTIERSIGSVPRTSEQTKRPLGHQSVSWSVQSSDRSSPSSSQPNWTSTNSMTTPQTAPPDFSPFFIHSAKDIPNINCNTSGFGSVAGGPVHAGNRPHHISINSSSASSNPFEQRRPIKVINIPPGSSSGGSVSPAATPPNARHIRMHFGDTGGTCTISAPPPTMQHYGSTPNVNQQYRSEIHTEAPTSQPVHSSSIVVNTSSHTNHLTPNRKLSAGSSGNDFSVIGKQTPNSPLIQSNPGSSSRYSSGKLSTPIQATSPGIAQSKPIFVEIKTDRMSGAEMHGTYNDCSFPPDFYPGGGVRPPPSDLDYMPQQSGAYNAQGSHLNYNNQYNPDFQNITNFPPSQYHHEQMYPQNLQQRHPGFNSPSTNLYQPKMSTGYSPSTFLQLNPSTNPMGYPLSGHVFGQTPAPLVHFSQYNPHPGHSSGVHIPKSPSIGVGQLSLSSRSNSQDSEYNMATDFDGRRPTYNTMGSRVSSHSSLSSDSSSSHVERIDSAAHNRSGSIPEDAEYIRALVQNQKSQLQKLFEEINQDKIILANLQLEVNMMRMMNKGKPSHVTKEDILQISEENRQLQTDIQKYMNERDKYEADQISNIKPSDQQNFFDNMPTGQQDSIYSRTPARRSSPPRSTPPPRPPPPIPARQRSADPVQSGGVSSSDIFRVPPVPPAQPVITSGDSEEGESWNCPECTFSNHPALRKCEICEGARDNHHLASPMGPPIPSSHQSRSPLHSRFAPGVIGGAHHRSASPHSSLGHHHHAGT